MAPLLALAVVAAAETPLEPVASPGIPVGPAAVDVGVPVGPAAVDVGVPVGPAAVDVGVPVGPAAVDFGIPVGPVTDSGLAVGSAATEAGVPVGAVGIEPASEAGLALGSGAASALGSAAATHAGLLTLSDAVRRALAAGPEARIARLEAHRASEAASALRGSYLPQVEITSEAGWSNRFDETFTAIGRDGKVNKFGLATIGANRGWFNVYLSQMLFDLKQWRLIEREELAAEAAALQENLQRDDVTMAVTRRYASLLRVQRRSQVSQEQLVDAEWLAELAAARHEAGRALDVENSLASLHRQGAELEAESARYEIAAAETDLWIAVGEGEEPNGPLVVDATTMPSVEGPVSVGQIAELVSAAPELRVLDLRRRMELVAVEAARAGRLPKLSFVTGYTHYGVKRFDNYDDELWVGVDLSIPIFDGFQSKHNIKGAEHGAEIAQIRYESTLQSKRAEVRELVKRLETGRQRLEIARRRAETAREQQRLADLNLRSERGGLAEALAAREQVARYELQVIDLHFDQIQLWANLQHHLGRLTSQIVSLPPSSQGTAYP
ncbi:MAG: TolC family protein [Myxococcota bacterium]|nr:TolC family protein [Myxococcota bacterium]